VVVVSLRGRRRRERTPAERGEREIPFFFFVSVGSSAARAECEAKKEEEEKPGETFFPLTYGDFDGVLGKGTALCWLEFERSPFYLVEAIDLRQ
jgi:hypothetical protein